MSGGIRGWTSGWHCGEALVAALSNFHARRRLLTTVGGSGRILAALVSVAAALCVPVAVASCVPAAAASAPTASTLQAFLLTGAPDSFADLQAHAGEIGVVYPTYYECNSKSGEVQGGADAEIDAYAVAHDIAELPRFSCQDGALVHRILTDPPLRAQTLARLTTLAANPAYGGINLDLENGGPADRGALSLFVQALARRLHAEHRRLAVDVVGVTAEAIPRPASGFYNYRALSANADTVFVMAWGTHWEGSAPGPLAPLSYVRGVARFIASLPHARRFVLGVPLYGLDWPLAVPDTRSAAALRSGAGRTGSPRSRVTAGQAAAGGRRIAVGRAVALQYAAVLALMREQGATPRRDQASGELTFSYTHEGVAHRVWYMDARAVLERTAIARRYGLAAGVWRLGEEDQSLWTALGVHDKVASPFMDGRAS
jgi:spore germination protein YaaH